MTCDNANEVIKEITSFKILNWFRNINERGQFYFWFGLTVVV